MRPGLGVTVALRSQPNCGLTLAELLVASTGTLLLLGVLAAAWNALVASDRRWVGLRDDTSTLRSALREWREDRRAATPPARFDPLPYAMVEGSHVELGPYFRSDGQTVTHRFERSAGAWVWERRVETGGTTTTQRLAHGLVLRHVRVPTEDPGYSLAEVLDPSFAGTWWAASPGTSAANEAWSGASGELESVPILAQHAGLLLIAWSGATSPAPVLVRPQSADPAANALRLEVTRGAARVELTERLAGPG